MNNLPSKEEVQKRLDGICDCEFDYPEEDSWHYLRTCEACDHQWGGLHCPHDGYQNPCPRCGLRPKVVSLKIKFDTPMVGTHFDAYLMDDIIGDLPEYMEPQIEYQAKTDQFLCDICEQHVIPQHRFVRNTDLKQGHLLCLANVKVVGYRNEPVVNFHERNKVGNRLWGIFKRRTKRRLRFRGRSKKH